MTINVMRGQQYSLTMSEKALGKAISGYEPSVDNSVEHECPTCDGMFSTDRGVKIHHAKVHGESIAKKTVTCEWCEEPFERYEGDIKPDESQCCSNACKYALHSVSIAGENNPHWAGGYKGRQNKYWFGVREKIRERDGYECQECGADESELKRELDVHHIIPWMRFDDPKDADYGENMVSLCASCHAQIEWDRKKNEQDKADREIDSV